MDFWKEFQESVKLRDTSKIISLCDFPFSVSAEILSAKRDIGEYFKLYSTNNRPIVIALAGSNGAGKSTFYESFLADAGLRFINADVLSASLEVSAYEAAELATSIRSALVKQLESFIFETVLSDPVGEKVEQLASYAALGYTVVLIFITLDNAEESIKRVAMRVSQGGHDVPDEKLRARFVRTQANLKRAINCLPYVIVYSNHDLAHPYQLVERYENGRCVLNRQSE